MFLGQSYAEDLVQIHVPQSFRICKSGNLSDPKISNVLLWEQLLEKSYQKLMNWLSSSEDLVKNENAFIGLNSWKVIRPHLLPDTDQILISFK